MYKFRSQLQLQGYGRVKVFLDVNKYEKII